MQDVHLGAIDLNLLVALDALLIERSVTRAANRIGLTQSAMSHALARLRTLFGDELLVRSNAGMVPTMRGEALAAPIRGALEQVGRALAPVTFDPKTARGKVLLATSDYVELVLLPKVVARLAEEAPGIDLRLVSTGDEVYEDLARGALDFFIAPPSSFDERAGIAMRRLFEDRFVCIVRNGHPLATKKLTLARFTAARHALISPRGKEGGFVDDALARLGLKRRVAVAVPHFMVAPHLVATSDLILTVAQRVAAVLAEPLGLTILAPPPELALAGFGMAMIWHERSQADPMLKWARELLARVAKSIGAPGG
jgi:DNA-binding transcriptional LysR family regulator